MSEKRPTFELYLDANDRYGFRHVRGNGQILFRSVTYSRKTRAREALREFLQDVRQPDAWLRRGDLWLPWNHGEKEGD